MEIRELMVMLLALAENDGLTLKGYKPITYKTGYQVADYGNVYNNARGAAHCIIRMKGDCGIWYSEGLWYIDHSMRIKTKRDAIAMGKKYHQISILKWETMKLIYC